MKKMYTSIDIGSDSIKMIVAEMIEEDFSIIAQSEVKSKGIKKNVIVDVNDALISIKEVVNNIESKLGIKIKKVVASVPAYYAEFKKVKGSTTITNEDKKVTGDDILRAMQASVYNKFTEDRTLITILPIKFKLDNKSNILDPTGLVGDTLEVEATMVTTPRKNVDSIITILQSVGLKVVDVNISPIADYYQYKDKDFDNKLIAIVNMGADTTTVSIFKNHIIQNMKILRFGGSSIDEYISQIFKLDKKESNKIKEKFAISHKKYSQIDEIYETINLNKNLIKITQYDISRVVMNITEEMLEKIKNELFLLTNEEIKYIIFTGGSTELYRFSYLIEEHFEKQAKLGNIDTLGIRNNKYSVSAGLIKFFHDKLQLRNKEYSMFDKNEEDELSESKKKSNIVNKNVLNKVFGYIFDN